MQKFLNILFLIIAVLTMLEYYFICGIFTGTIMLTASLLSGLANLFYSASHKRFNEAILYGISSAALCIGYLKLM